MRRASQSSFGSPAHLRDCLVPTFDDLPGSNFKSNWFPSVVAAIKDLAISQLADIVNFYHSSFGDELTESHSRVLDLKWASDQVVHLLFYFKVYASVFEVALVELLNKEVNCGLIDVGESDINDASFGVLEPSIVSVLLYLIK